MSGFDDSFFLENPWLDITEPNYPDGRYLYQRDLRFFVSMDEDKNFNFFIREEGVHHLEKLPNLKGIELRVDHFENETRLVCTLTDEEILDKFAVIAKDVAFVCGELETSKIFQMFMGRIESWADFLKPSRKGLSYSEWIGFWGEMYVLSNLIIPQHPIADAINFWIGPLQQKQDFTLNDMALEIKTTVSGEPNEIQISSLDQLHKITPKLYLMHLHINKSNDQLALSLQDMYEKVISICEEDTGLKNEFINKISSLYGRASQDQLEEKFNFLGLESYDVNDHFPSLTKLNAPSSVTKARYSLDPSQLSGFQLNESFQELTAND